MQTAYNLLQHEVYSVVFPAILKSATGSSVVLHLWHVNPSIPLRGFIDALNMDPDNMNRVLDLCHELKVNLVLNHVSVNLFLSKEQSLRLSVI